MHLLRTLHSALVIVEFFATALKMMPTFVRPIFNCMENIRFSISILPLESKRLPLHCLAGTM